MSRRPAILARRASKGIDGAHQVHRPRPPLLANASGLVWVDRIPGNLIPAVRLTSFASVPRFRLHDVPRFSLLQMRFEQKETKVTKIGRSKDSVVPRGAQRESRLDKHDTEFLRGPDGPQKRGCGRSPDQTHPSRVVDLLKAPVDRLIRGIAEHGRARRQPSRRPTPGSGPESSPGPF